MRKGTIRVEAGNGVENSWRGYFSHAARETSIVVDAERLVPLEEQTGATTVRYADWQDVGGGKWVPRRIDVLSGSDPLPHALRLARRRRLAAASLRIDRPRGDRHARPARGT